MSFTQVDFRLDFGSGYVSVAPPMNWKGFMPKIIFTDQLPNITFEGLNFEWVGDPAKQLYNYFKAGTTGGRGIGEGIGLQVWTCDSNPIIILQGYIDLGDAATRFECDKVQAKVVETGTADWLNKVCAAISFQYLASLPVGAPGRIIPGQDFKLTPYCLHRDLNIAQEILVDIEIFTIVKETAEAIYKISEYIGDLTGQTTTAVTELGTSAPTLLATVSGLILYVIYLTTMLIALINLVKQTIDAIIQFKKSKACMRYDTHFQRICDYFGMAYSSTITQQGKYMNDTWMPAKNIMPDISNPLNVFHRPYDESINFPNNPKVFGYYFGNCASFIKHACDKYNAAIFITTNPTTGAKTLHFEEKHHFQNTAAFTIPNEDLPGYTYNLPEPNGTNWSEMPGNFYLAFQTDTTDLNTTDRYTGTNVECTVRPNVIYNERNLTYETGIEILLECALAKRKDWFNKIENLLNTLINAADTIVNFVLGLMNGVISAINTVIALFGGGNTTIQPIPLVTNTFVLRLGWMVLSDNSFSVSKCFIGQQVGADWMISPNSEADMSANSLFQDFHGKNLATRGNQQYLYFNRRFRFCCADFRALLNCNVVQTAANFGRIRTLTWDIHNEEAINVDYAVFNNFTNNLTETIVIDGGN